MRFAVNSMPNIYPYNKPLFGIFFYLHLHLDYLYVKILI